MMQILPVRSKKEWKRFIKLPYELHKNKANWIPPLIFDQKNRFDERKNSMLRHSEYQLFLLWRGERPIGRIAAFVDHAANAYWRDSVGFFGSYECIQDAEAGDVLLGRAEQWLLQRNMTKMWGPWNFLSQDIGFVVEGHDIPPVFLSSFSPPHYAEHCEAYGMHKIKDLLVYDADASKGYVMPRRFLDHAERQMQKHGIRIRHLDMKHVREDARKLVRMTNRSLAGNWGFYPISEEEADELASDLKRIVHSELVLFAEVAGKEAGFVITLPDINTILKGKNGRLFPLGFLRLLIGIKHIRSYRVWAMGVIPEYQRKGVAESLFREIYMICKTKGARIEANWVLEDNNLMNNALRKLNFRLIKRYRIYQKRLAASAFMRR